MLWGGKFGFRRDLRVAYVAVDTMVGRAGGD